LTLSLKIEHKTRLWNKVVL